MEHENMSYEEVKDLMMMSGYLSGFDTCIGLLKLAKFDDAVDLLNLHFHKLKKGFLGDDHEL